MSSSDTLGAVEGHRDSPVASLTQNECHRCGLALPLAVVHNLLPERTFDFKHPFNGAVVLRYGNMNLRAARQIVSEVDLRQSGNGQDMLQLP